MGNDGGSIPTRRELVKSAARAPTTTELKSVLAEKLAYLWSTCPLSRTPLRQPIVSDSSGALYNKDAVLQFLLPDGGHGDQERTDMEAVLGGRVKGLRDVVEVLFDDGKREENGNGDEGLWICPVIGKMLGPNVNSVYLVPCGHAFSEEGIKELVVEGVDGGDCVQCNTPYTSGNIIPIHPTKAEEVERLVLRSQRLAADGLSHSLKKNKGYKNGENKKKRKKEEQKEGDQNGVQAILIREASTNGAAALSISTSGPPSSNNHTYPQPPRSGTSTPQPPRSGTSTPVPSSGIKNAATASLTARVLEEEAQKAKRRKLGQGSENLNLKSLFTSSRIDEGRKDGDFMTRGFSIPKEARR